ncbi:hypothetical protein ABK040_005589 [Willaertia magna]
MSELNNQQDGSSSSTGNESNNTNNTTQSPSLLIMNDEGFSIEHVNENLEKNKDATLTIRLIRSFEYRNIKPMILHHINIYKMTGNELLELILNKINTESNFNNHKNRNYNTLKLYHSAHSFKSQNLVINLQDDDHLILNLNKSLVENNVKNEAEISCFILEEYLNFKKNPQIKW